MKKAKKLVVGNWKMNPLDLDEAKNIAGTVKKSLKNIKKVETVVCPPFIYITSLSGIKSPNISLGAQDAFYESAGSFTGEVSFAQLPQFKVEYVILGHSERRKMGEGDDLINKKVRSVLVEGMSPILCVGENTRDQHGEYLNLVRSQVVGGLRDVPKKLIGDVVIAYEPVWAIGAKEAMRPREVHEMYIFIKKVLRELYGISADSVRVLYGGAVDVGNTEEIIRDGFVQGLLIGRESLKAKNFVEIIKIVDQI
ncbi:MAG: triose-phosphate isomerase [Nitrospira sp.]